MSTNATDRASTIGITEPAYSLPTPPEAKDLKHYLKRNQVFQNQWPSFLDPGGFTVGVKMTRRRFSGKDVPNPAQSTVAVRNPELHPNRNQDEALRATWLGHACYLLKFPSAFRVLFDPGSEERCSPLPKNASRKRPAKLRKVPSSMLWSMVMSHNRYDHVSPPTLTAIAAKHPGVRFFCALETAT